jgi:hypothetical protein
MPVTHMNRKRDTYYLHAGKTKTGNPSGPRLLLDPPYDDALASGEQVGCVGKTHRA